MQYLVLIGDIVSSKEIVHRAEVQRQLAAVLGELNGRTPHPVSPYTITLGDEFQAVFASAGGLFGDALQILAALHPQKVRFSSGVGEIATHINPIQAIGMDGPAFHRARLGLDRLKGTASLFSVEGVQDIRSEMARDSLGLVSHMLAAWNANRLKAAAFLSRGATVDEIAVSLRISEQAVYKTIQAGALRVVLDLLGDIARMLDEALRGRP